MRTKPYRALHCRKFECLAVAAAILSLALIPLDAYATGPDPGPNLPTQNAADRAPDQATVNSSIKGPAASEGPALQISRFKTQTNRPDLISDQAMAIKIARIILSSIYGKTLIDKEEPLNCELQDGVWIVTGSFNHPFEKGKPPWKGGVAEIHILKRTGEVLDVFHSK